LAVPLVYGAVERFTGQVSVFDAGRQRGRAPCYRCLFPEPPGADAAPNCAEAGVLGVLPGLIGMLQATEALKLLLGIGDPLVGRLLTVDALGMRFRELALAADPDCQGSLGLAISEAVEEAAADPNQARLFNDLSDDETKVIEILFGIKRDTNLIRAHGQPQHSQQWPNLIDQ
jgi:hypothetical protein